MFTLLIFLCLWCCIEYQVTGAVIVAASVRVLIDPDFSHLLFQGNGNHSTSGHVLIATGAVMILVGLIGCVGAWRESPFLLGSVYIIQLSIIIHRKWASLSLSVPILCRPFHCGWDWHRILWLCQNGGFLWKSPFQHLLGCRALLRQWRHKYYSPRFPSARSKYID